jgi:hypothetical protein
MSKQIRVRLLYQEESPRTYARAIAPTSVLANRNFPVFAQQQLSLNTTTNYDITMLVDWRPLSDKLPPHYGRVIWDVPDDIEDHLSDPVYQAWFQQISCISVPNHHLFEVVRGLAHKVVILPTYIPTAALMRGAKPNQRDAIGIFGRVEIGPVLPYLLPWLERERLPVISDSHETGRVFQHSAVFTTSFHAYQQALSHLRAVVLPATPRKIGDGFWARDAAFMGIPVITTRWHATEMNYRQVAETPEQIVSLLENDRPRHYQDMAVQKRQIAQDWAVQYQIEKVWWNAWEKLAY